MALQFAAVVMFGKEIAAGDLPFPMLAIRFAGQAALLFVVLLAAAQAAGAGAGGASAADPRGDDRLRDRGGACSSPL